MLLILYITESIVKSIASFNLPNCILLVEEKARNRILTSGN